MIASAFLVACTFVCSPARCQDPVCVPSPQEYLLEMAANAAAWLAVSPPAGVDLDKQKDILVGECDTDAHVKNWETFVASRNFLAPALAHALVLAIRERSKLQFGLSDEQCAEIRSIVDSAVRKRKKSLEDIRSEWTCVAAEDWYAQCVWPGAFVTPEYVACRLLCGIPYKDAYNDRLFYRLGDHARSLPAYLQRLSDFVSRCCTNVWCDDTVKSRIAEIVRNGELSWKNIEIYGPNMDGVLTVPSQEAVDKICGAMTSLYVDAILRDMDLPSLFATVAEDVQNPASN